jgi:hypothetical protein
MKIDLGSLTPRQLQTEAARVLSADTGYGNHDLVRFNKLAHHDSHAWYKAVIAYYVEEHGDLPSRTGPGMAVKLLWASDNDI